MAQQTAHATDTVSTITPTELVQVSGGASIYIDGMYWGEGELDLRPWPGGFPVVYRPKMTFI
jgi:hypothetical protein